jgi:hypothetical protein
MKKDKKVEYGMNNREKEKAEQKVRKKMRKEKEEETEEEDEPRFTHPREAHFVLYASSRLPP